MTARSADKLEELVAQLAAHGADATALPADLTSEAERRRLLDAVTQRFDGLDVLVNNAGVASAGHFADGTEAVLRQVMEVNFFAPAELIRLAMPVLMRGRQPAIVNVASMCGRRGMPAWTEYSASKFALCGLTEALRGEIRAIRHRCAAGRAGADEQRPQPAHAPQRSADEDRFHAAAWRWTRRARRILEALRRNRTETVLGRDARWMVLANRFFPRWVDALDRPAGASGCMRRKNAWSKLAACHRRDYENELMCGIAGIIDLSGKRRPAPAGAIAGDGRRHHSSRTG